MNDISQPHWGQDVPPADFDDAVPLPEAPVMPHSDEAEQYVLGSVLFDNDVLSDLAWLKPEQFYNPVHGRIWKAMRDTVQGGQVADPVTLGPIFNQDSGLADVGGAGYLADLANAADGPASLTKTYARHVSDFATRREVIRIADDLKASAMDVALGQTGDDLIRKAEQDLTFLDTAGNRRANSILTAKEAGKQSLEAAEAAYKNYQENGGKPPGVLYDIEDLDHAIGGMQGGELHIVAGRPGMGKTAFSLHLTKSVSQKGDRVFYASLEMPARALMRRLQSAASGVPVNQIKTGAMDYDDWRRVEEAQARLDSLSLIIDEKSKQSIADISTVARRLQRTGGLGLVVVDYLGLMDHSQRGNENYTRAIEKTTTGLKALSKELDVPVVLLAQLNRGVESREDKRPQLSDLKDSGAIEQDADSVLFLYRDEYYLKMKQPPEGHPEEATWFAKHTESIGKIEFILGKVRDGETQIVHGHFDAPNMHFEGALG